MNYKFNPFERAVGLFLVLTFFGSIFMALGIAVKKKWFEEKSAYHSYVSSASNIRVGSSVVMAGLKVGQIESVELDHTQKIKVTFNVYKKYESSMLGGTRVQFLRPFIIGDKVLTLTPGTEGAERIAAGSLVPTADSTDLMDLLSGTRIEEMVSKVDSILKNLDDTLILGKDIAIQVGDKKKLQKTLENVAFASQEVRRALPHITQKAPHLYKNLNTTVENLVAISSGLRELQPEGSKKTVELLNESVIVLQAMQKSFFLRSGVRDVKAEMKAVQEVEVQRLPARD
ncbi:MAG TPA: MlaD family protein [Bacteriovoracaceae bacterium]|nr:MlaD family protein [Bacteriovoracaceae bacterium]